jgi:hypothetical protein
VKPGEFLGWQSTPFAAIPEKAAAYTRHFVKIARATEADILNEARTQFEQYGFGMKGGFESAARQAQSAVQGPIALLSDLSAASTGAANETAKVTLDASGQAAQTSNDTGVEAAKADSNH